MIKPGKIQEWIEEIEQRPLAAPFIVRTLSARVIELDKVNEELRVENLNLQSGKKIQEYERKIAELEYQIKLLKRQVAGGTSPVPMEQPSLLVYDAFGKMLITEFTPPALVSGHTLGTIAGFEAPRLDDIHLLTANTSDELLFLFDSGRIQTQKAGDLTHTPMDQLDWNDALQIDLRSGERLIAVIPINEIPMMDGCLQISRKGYARYISQEYFRSFLSERNIGKGIRTAADSLFTLTPCHQNDVYVLVTRRGFVSARLAGKLAITLYEIQKLDMQDYVVGAFTIQSHQQLVIADQTGGVYIQKNPWTDPAGADGSKRRLLLAGAKAGGVDVLGAAAADPGSWHFRLTTTGKILIGRVEDTSENRKGKASSSKTEALNILAFTIWQPEKQADNGNIE